MARSEAFAQWPVPKLSKFQLDVNLASAKPLSLFILPSVLSLA